MSGGKSRDVFDLRTVYIALASNEHVDMVKITGIACLLKYIMYLIFLCYDLIPEYVAARKTVLKIITF